MLVLILVLGRKRREREAGGRALARFNRGLNGKVKQSMRPCSAQLAVLGPVKAENKAKKKNPDFR